MNHRRKFYFDETKSTQLASLFLRFRGGKMKHLKLIKLMYLADRESFRRWGHPITGDVYFSMDNGPILSNVLDLIGTDQLPNQKSVWLDSIHQIPDHEVELVQDPGTGRLSDEEENLAREIFDEYGHMNRWSLVDLTHQFAEYRQTDTENRRWPIEYEQLLRGVGKTPEETIAICESLSEVSQAKSLLAI